MKLRSVAFHALRACFRSLPVTEGTRDTLRAWFLQRFPAIRPGFPHGQTVALVERRARLHAGGRAIGHVEHRVESLPSPLPATLVAFYLPQFHVIPENDRWWGKGFTEWRNVARALPQFEGHAQPRLPGDLGFYHLDNPRVMRDQVELARSYGVGAFCFYFYWFDGKTLLEAPLQHWLEDASISFPFCLCWANENWSRRWDGRAEDVLIAQAHSAEDDLAFIEHVARYLRDPRYLRVDGKPLLLVYRPGLLPDPSATTRRWRAWCRESGVGEICIAYVQAFERPVPSEIGFDAAVEFPPNLSTPSNVTARQRLINPDYNGEILDWRELAKDYADRALPAYTLFPGVNCGWDNEPRRPGRGRTYLHASPHGYGEWLHKTIHSRLASVAPDRRLVFINAWNEWAEGAVLEPDSRLGYAWLAATRDALVTDTASLSPLALNRPCVVIHAWYPETFEEILQVLAVSGLHYRLIVTTTHDKVAAVDAILTRLRISAEIVVAENRGRDILPFLRVAERLRAEGEDVVLKLHTKQSPHRNDGEHWRQQLITELLPKGGATSVFAAFRRNPKLGLLGPDGHLSTLETAWGANESNVRALAARLGISEPEATSDCFASGSMFWVRLDALSALIDAHLDEDDFEIEAGQLDGTFAHAVERIIGVCVRANDFHVTVTRSATEVENQELVHT